MRIGRRDLIVGALGIALAGVARAERPARVYRVAWLANVGGPGSPWREEFERCGYFEGRNLEVRRAPEPLGPVEGLKDWLEETVRWRPDAIVTQFTVYTRAAMKATGSIPIVFTYVADPVGAGIVKSLGRPEGNVTGVSQHYLTLTLKRIQLIRELLPQARRLALIMDSTVGIDSRPPDFWPEVRRSAQGLKLELIEEDMSQSPGGFDEAFEKISRRRVDIVLPIGPWPSLRVNRYGRIDELQDRHRIPVLGNGGAVGGHSDALVVQLGADVEENRRVTVDLVARILGGAKPGDIPVQQISRTNLVVNLRTARELGIAVPKSILTRADRVIE